MIGPLSANVANLPTLVGLGRRQGIDSVKEAAAHEPNNLKKELAILEIANDADGRNDETVI